MQFWVKIKGRIDTNLSRDTPLYPDTSSHQISTENLHSFRRYRAEGNFGFKVTESRSKVASTRFFHATHLCPLIHPPTKYQPKIFSHLGMMERKENIMQFGVMVTGSRSKVTSTQIFWLTHVCPLIHPHTKYQPKIFIHLGDTERKGILVSRSQGQDQRSHRHDSFTGRTFVPRYITHANFMKKSCSIKELQSGHKIAYTAMRNWNNGGFVCNIGKCLKLFQQRGIKHSDSPMSE
jgi:hypothetical protein